MDESLLFNRYSEKTVPPHAGGSQKVWRAIKLGQKIALFLKSIIGYS